MMREQARAWRMAAGLVALLGLAGMVVFQVFFSGVATSASGAPVMLYAYLANPALLFGVATLICSQLSVSWKRDLPRQLLFMAALFVALLHVFLVLVLAFATDALPAGLVEPLLALVKLSYPWGGVVAGAVAGLGLRPFVPEEPAEPARSAGRAACADATKKRGRRG